MKILLVSGSTRDGSTNTAFARTAHAVAADGVTTTLYEGLSTLPAFNPDDDQDPLHPAVADIRQRAAAADAVLFCTPEYAGTLPGSFKNMLDWLVGSGELYGKPVAWVNVAAEGRGMNAQQTLRTVLGYMGAKVVKAACVHLPVAREAVDADGMLTGDGFRPGIVEALRAITDHAGATTAS